MASAHGIPEAETTAVARGRERTKGAISIAIAKRMCEASQAVRSSGLWLWRKVKVAAKAGGGRGVNFSFACSGDWMMKGRTTVAKKVIMEKMTREREPMRPILPSLSGEEEMAEGSV